MSENIVPTKCGFVAVIGRPNVGKSSLLNAIIGKKISITSFKPQTTRQQILGIKTENNVQVVYVDTPGIHHGGKRALNKQMNKSARRALIDVDVIVWVIEALNWTNEDELVAKYLISHPSPIIIALNKVDLIKDKAELLPMLTQLNELLPKAQIIPLSARKRSQIDVLEKQIEKHLPLDEFYYPIEQSMSHSPRFHVAEIIREKLTILLGQELPYSLTVEIEKFETLEKIINIHALIWVEREGQKAIVIGEKGEMLRTVGTKARIELEHFFKKKVFLKLWVKVKESWADDINALNSLGYQD